MASRKHAHLTSPEIKTLAAKALSSPSRLTTEETRELGGSVLAHIEQTVAIAAEAKAAAKAAKTPPAKTNAAPSKFVPAKKTVAKKAAAKKLPAKKAISEPTAATVPEA